MNANAVVAVLGWFFLVLNVVWPSDKWGGRLMKIAFSSFSTGLFFAGAIYAFLG